MPQNLTVSQFFARFPDDDKCLEHVMSVRYGLRHVCKACGVEATFHKLKDRKAYSCAQCGDHLYPCAGTIFQDSRTSLQSWFYAIYLFVVTRHGVSGKELQRGLGVTYKTAWRMGQQIRKLMESTDTFEALKGHVEIDESFIGGKTPGRPAGPPVQKPSFLAWSSVVAVPSLALFPMRKPRRLNRSFLRRLNPAQQSRPMS